MESQQIGRYEVLSILGRGAMGVVYKAADPVLNRIVAVKTINLSLDPDLRGEYEARFQQEAKAAGSLSHPAIVTIYDLGKTGDLAYIAMEYLDGRELHDLISAEQRLPVKQATSIAAQVASGLSYAHQHGIVHRDIKPANIMVLKDGFAKITDFGIARMRVSEVKTQTGMRLGSPKYMSPEQVLGQRVDHRTDIFSLGVVLYEMLTGKAPFRGDSLEALMYQTVNIAPLPPSRINPDVPEMLDLILAKMLEKRLENRYQSAADLASDLRECEKQYGSSPAPDPGASVGLHELPQSLPAAADKTLVLAPQAALSRRGDAAEHEAEAGSLGLSPVVESFSATQRLAKEVGMKLEFDEYSATIKLAPGESFPADTASAAQPVVAAPAATRPSPGAARADGASAGKHSEMPIVIAVLLAAVVAAALILLV
ncbi:MAG: serine/threonine-protein kinase [Betaproteobacteria bacterium]|nr:serine/threonine-protein kinase [Betaproteobacteria bacterium]